MEQFKSYRIIALIICTLLSFSILFPIKISAQDKSPVSWAFYSRRIAPGLYQIHTIASVKEGWCFEHQTPVEAAPIIGSLLFAPHANVMEINIINAERTVADIPGAAAGEKCQYDSNIRLVHVVRLKQPVGTNLSGSISYKLTNELQQSTFQDTINFNIVLR